MIELERQIENNKTRVEQHNKRYLTMMFEWAAQPVMS